MLKPYSQLLIWHNNDRSLSDHTVEELLMCLWYSPEMYKKDLRDVNNNWTWHKRAKVIADFRFAVQQEIKRRLE